MDEPVIFEGVISVRAALQARSRPVLELRVARERRTHDVLMLERTAQRAGVPIKVFEEAEIGEMTHGRSHGGVVALVGDRYTLSLAELAERRPTFVVMLDGIEDPFNMGQSVRALYAAGCDGLVVRARSWHAAAGTVARASAGASEHLDTAAADSPEDAARFFKEHGMRVIAAGAEPGSEPHYRIDWVAPFFLMIGGERRGISRGALSYTDVVARIPYGRDFAHSLGTTAATSALAFEVLRQRGMPPPAPKPARRR